MTDLEQIILGVVGEYGPCTAYRVRRVFAESPSGHWSGSAGAIYPAISRLERRGLLRSQKKAGDGRSARLYRLSPGGGRALRNWLSPPLPDGGQLMPIDPLRVRIRFIKRLPPEKRRAVIVEARHKLRDLLRTIVQSHQDERDDPVRRLMHSGAILGVKAQLAWLDEVDRVLAIG